MCCAWMEVLPSLLSTSHDWFLSPAIKALGTSILSRGSKGPAPISTALEARSAAMNTLRGAVSREEDASFNVIAASIMCLFLSEVRTNMKSVDCVFTLC